MKSLLFLICTISILFVNPFSKDSIRVKIELTNLSEIKTLVDLGLKAEGYVLEEKYWLVDLTKREIGLLKSTDFKYTHEKVEENLSVSFGHASFLLKGIQTHFDNCGYQLTLSYELSKKLNFLSIQVYNLEGKSYLKKLGYNIPKDRYTTKLNAQYWPDGIYLLRLETVEQKRIQKVIHKDFLTKKI